MAEKNVYKETLNLPQTGFDMRAGLLAKEPALQAKWKAQNLYERIRTEREGSDRFILHDGPPYANGNIHMGTALNKVLKDVVVRVKTMTGFDAPYIPGWDCHGLPIEQKVLDDAGAKLDAMDAMDIRTRCREYAERFASLQSEQFQRLGVMGEFDAPYITMHPRYEACVLEVLARLVEQGLVRKQLKPVHWSIANRTALADAELEYHDRTDPSIYVLFRLVGDSAQSLPHRQGDPLYAMIWTTTPWTLPGNLGIAVHPDLQYACVHLDTTDGPCTVVVAAERLSAVLRTAEAKRPGWVRSHEVVGTVSGQQLVDLGLFYEHPLFEGKLCPVVPAPYVTVEDGTGLVHTAPGHGVEDYQTGLRYDLGVYCPVLEDGTFDETAPEFLVGKSVWDANPLVIARLRERKTLVADEPIVHSYPHDWRSKTPTIFRATEQWFVGVDRPLDDQSITLRQLALETVRRPADENGVDFIPAWGRNRMTGMLESRPDWCISRQRAWGLPIPAFHNEAGEVLLTPTSVRAVARVFGEHGSDAWFTLSSAELLAGYDPRHDPFVQDPERFPVAGLTPGRDILDVWFESGSSWFAVAIARGLVDDIPVDLYLEGSDQHRGWFQLSLLPALGTAAVPPFKAVLTHGFIVDENGYKMSKSLGNVINVIDQLEKRGADVLRLWTASQNYQDDIRCSDALIAQSEDAYRKIRNTLRFLMGSCYDFNPATDAADPAPHSVDAWMRMELHRLIRDVRTAYDRYEFHRAMRAIYEFCTVQASNVYLSAVKDRLYCDAPASPRRRSTQTVIHEVLMALVKLLAPVLPHTCDEAWDAIPHRPADEPDTVHLAALPDYDAAVLRLAEDLTPVNPDNGTFYPDVLQAGAAWAWQRVMELRDVGMVKLEALRNAGVKNSLDAEAVFLVRATDEASLAFVQTYLVELEDLLGVGCARIEHVEALPEGEAIDVEVVDTRETYPRCARSWKRRPDVGSDPEYPELSARDAAVMRELKA